MTSSSDFLRLLEPAIRPGGPVDPVARRQQPADQPFEEQSFQQLLAKSQTQLHEPSTAGEVADDAPPPDPLAPLTGVTQVQNFSLRELIAQSVHALDPATTTDTNSTANNRSTQSPASSVTPGGLQEGS